MLGKCHAQTARKLARRNFASSSANRSAAFAPSELSTPTTITPILFAPPVSLSLGIDVLERILRLRVGTGFGELDRLVDDALCVSIESCPLCVVQLEPLTKVPDGIARLPQPLQLVLVAIDLRVADVVAGQPLRLAEQEDGPTTEACVLERVERCEVDCLDVLPADVNGVHPERQRALRQIRDRLVLRLRRRL